MSKVKEPIPIAQVGKRYFLYDIAVVTHLRKNHRICGVLIGSIPQMPQQNVFLGLPLELMPEEARLLVEKEVGFIVDDVAWHQNESKRISEADRAVFEQDLGARGKTLAHSAISDAKQRQQAALQRLGKNSPGSIGPAPQPEPSLSTSQEIKEMDSLFESTASESTIVTKEKADKIAPWGWTPATSYPPFPVPTPSSDSKLPEVPHSYPLFAHLHSKGYFLSPGLRFGCQYLAYPGDPLRFHSHFLSVGYEWDEEIDLIDIVAGGRLGTGVKKAFLIGGSPPNTASLPASPVRTFCVEWGGM